MEFHDGLVKYTYALYVWECVRICDQQTIQMRVDRQYFGLYIISIIMMITIISYICLTTILKQKCMCMHVSDHGHGHANIVYKHETTWKYFGPWHYNAYAACWCRWNQTELLFMIFRKDESVEWQHHAQRATQPIISISASMSNI